MYLFSVDFSKNNLLIEQTNTNSFYNLRVLNKFLIEHQMINFSGLSIDKSFLINCKQDFEFPLFDVSCINEFDIFKELTLIDNKEFFIAFRNDVFFEINELNTLVVNEQMSAFSDKNGFIFAVTGTVGCLKTLLNKDINLADIIKNSSRYVGCSEVFSDSYVMPLGDVKKYKELLIDILNNNTHFSPPFVAEGIFTDDSIPQGDYSIIPPVFISKSVQIESGSTIGPDTVIYSHSLISERTSVKNSVLFENVFVSSNCFIDGTVCCDNASIKRNSAVFSGSVIGADAMVGEDMTLENNSFINNSVKYDKLSYSRKNKRRFFDFNNKFQGLTPDKCALLGSAVAVVFKKPRVIVGCDGSPNSVCLKLAFISGLIASGSECFDIGVTFKSHIFYCAWFCACDYSVFFSGWGGGTDIQIFNSENEQISKIDCCNLFDYCNKGEFILENQDKCKNVRQIKGLRTMYIREITAFSENELPFSLNIICENKVLLKTLEAIIGKCVKNDGSECSFSVYMNERGTNVSLKFKDNLYSQKILKKLVFFFLKGDTKINFFESNLFKKLWQNDSVCLMIAVLNIIKYTNKDLDVLIGELPSFFVKEAYVNLNCSDSNIADKLNYKFNFNYQDGKFKIKFKDSYIKLENNKADKRIKVSVSSENMGISEELCRFFYEFLPDL